MPEHLRPGTQLRFFKQNPPWKCIYRHLLTLPQAYTRHCKILLLPQTRVPLNQEGDPEYALAPTPRVCQAPRGCSGRDRALFSQNLHESAPESPGAPPPARPLTGQVLTTAGGGGGTGLPRGNMRRVHEPPANTEPESKIHDWYHVTCSWAPKNTSQAPV